LNAVGLMLMEMGCIPGAVVEVEMIAPLGDPLAVRVAGYRLGIRRADALNILVVPE
jgi:ferrous iron transport protein A